MKIPFNLFHPPPAPPGFGKGTVLPESDASWFSRLALNWLGPFLNVGFSRPLEKDDLWELPDSRKTEMLTNILEQNYFARCPPSKRPRYMRDSFDQASYSGKEKEKQEEEEITANNPLYDESVFKALLQTFPRRIVGSGILLLVSETLRTTTPLVTKILITWLTESYIFARLTEVERIEAAAAGFKGPRGVGYGIGLAFAIFVMQESASLVRVITLGVWTSFICFPDVEPLHAKYEYYNQNQIYINLIPAAASMTTGLYVRTAIIGNIFRKSLRLSGQSRAKHSVGKITTLISTDTTRMDALSYLGHHAWSAPIQLAISIGLLIGNIGYSALAGLAVLLAAMPIQAILVAIMFNQSKKGIKITDQRVRITTEVLQGIRLIKVYGWEKFYMESIVLLREKEIKRIRTTSFAAALLIAMFSFMPQLAAVIAFITYALTKHELNIAVIFSSLQLFNVMQIPLLILPFVLSTVAQAAVSLERFAEFFTAEELQDPYVIDPSSPLALKVDGSFEWDVLPGFAEELAKKEKEDDKDDVQKHFAKKKEEAKAKKAEEKRKKEEAKRRKKGLIAEGDVTPIGGDEKEKQSPASDEKPFCLENLHLEIPRGKFVAIVGRVGSGKSSLLQALIGEMKRKRGEVIFGGTIAYVPQNPWIKNATLRENVLFGQDDNDKRFNQVIEGCSLKHDIEILPQGDSTEIGERGITLSGGQKARISLARAAYSRSDIVLLDDPLSAVDAYVGKSILENCLLEGPLSTRTRILVTHALHVLDRTDYIYVMDQGKIIEEGSYPDLMSRSTVFARLIEEYGNPDSRKQGPGAASIKNSDQKDTKRTSNNAVEDALMQAEERNTGAVSWDVWKKYLRSAGGFFWVPIVLGLLLLSQANNVATTLFLGFWTGDTISHFRQGDYMAVYAGLGASGAILSFSVTWAFVVAGLSASLDLYKDALSGVLNSAVSFFDTTPMGRIVSRLSKDQTTIDNLLPIILMQFLTTLASVIGTIGLVFYTFPYLGIIFLPMSILYYGASVYYRRSSVEAKRLDSLLRSILYGSYTETLTGLSTIRAYGTQDRSIVAAQFGLDMENRAYLMTVAMQRWLAIRLEFFANVLVLGIALFGAGMRTSVNPSKFSVVMTYCLSVTQVFSEMISLFAQSEQNMNAVERVLHYAELPAEESEARSIIPPTSWPTEGSIQFSHVKMSYRAGLPMVLKGITFKANGKEKIGIVGRTGSGKSSLTQALLRLFEIQQGKIEIDGVDIASLSLDVLRTRIAFVPQDTTLFQGTLRSNLDPQGLRTDAELISILKRAWLLPRDGPVDPVIEAKFSLDSVVADEGSNYSVGEKQLLALCRALVKNSRIIILDEATSSVDAETDMKLQRTIREEFSSSTLLCIAHRLNTIAHYDRIIVMDDGNIAEFDTVLNLFDKTGSIFRSLCDEAHLRRVDIVKLRQESST